MLDPWVLVAHTSRSLNKRRTSLEGGGLGRGFLCCSTERFQSIYICMYIAYM